MAESTRETPASPASPAAPAPACGPDEPLNAARLLTSVHTQRPPSAYGEPSASLVPAATAERKLVKFKLNGVELQVPAGTNLIEAARDQGVHIPYYCYHPGLTPAGNCRMCLVEASNSKKPIPACTTPVTEGLDIQTDSEGARKARAGVLELMLINHPLDCPICDKSGECMLQDHTFRHGKDRSRMVEPKELKHTKDLGNDIYIWGNRCIVCTRCVRFCDEISGTSELTVIERGDRSVIDVFPGYPLQNSLSGNVVDICPVGALISRDFLYTARVWYQKKVDSICTGCARGCNIEVQVKDNLVRRLVPRHNPGVNDYWMCDHGRHDIGYILGERRSLGYWLGASHDPAKAGKAVAEALDRIFKAHGAGHVGLVASAFQTNEELYLARRLVEGVGGARNSMAALARPAGQEEVFKKGFRVSADKNPNRRGVEALLGGGAFDRLEAISEKVESGSLRALVLWSDRPHLLLGEGPGEARLLAALEKLEALVVFQLERGAALPDKALRLPTTAFSEKDGTMVNEDGRIQRLRPATQLPRGLRTEVDVLQEALRHLTPGAGAPGDQADRDRWDGALSAEGVFRKLGAELGVPGASYKEVGKLGIPPGGPA